MNAATPPASTKHFAGFAAICAGFVAIGIATRVGSHGGAIDAGHRSIVPAYLGTMAGEWCLLWYVWRGVRARERDFFALAVRWTSPAVAVADVSLGVAFGVALVWLDAFVVCAIPSGGSHAVDRLLPQGPLEVALWVAVSATAGIVEELVYRGYLMAELRTRLLSVPAAVIVQGLWFGIMHAYEGTTSVVSICLIGVLFGVVAVLRKRLLANIVAHACVDLIEGLAPNLVRL